MSRARDPLAAARAALAKKRAAAERARRRERRERREQDRRDFARLRRESRAALGIEVRDGLVDARLIRATGRDAKGVRWA